MERKFKQKDEVWNKKDNRRDIFERYISHEPGAVFINRCGTYHIFLESEIEPYTGQDKTEPEYKCVGGFTANGRHVKLNQGDPHPFTVILKSGVKIGISEETNAFLIDEIQEGFKATDFSGNTFYRITQIAAIVPTENLT